MKTMNKSRKLNLIALGILIAMIAVLTGGIERASAAKPDGSPSTQVGVIDNHTIRFDAGGKLAGNPSGQYAIYELAPPDLSLADAFRIASSLGLTPLNAQAQRPVGVTLFEDQSRNVWLSFEERTGSLKFFPDLTRQSHFDAPPEVLQRLARDWLSANGLLPFDQSGQSGGSELINGELLSWSRQTATREGSRLAPEDVVRTVHFDRGLDGLKVYGPSSRLSVNLGAQGVVGFYRAFRPLSGNRIPVEIISADEAYQQFLNEAQPNAAAQIRAIDLIYYEQGQQFVQPAYRFLLETAGPAGARANHIWLVPAARQTPEPIINRLQTSGPDPKFPPPKHLPDQSGRPGSAASAETVKYGRYVIREDHECWLSDAKAFGASLESANAFRRKFSGFPAVKDEQF